MLAPERLRELAGGPDSLEALLLTPQRVYTMLVAGTDNPLLPPPFRPRAARALLRTPWVLEGIAQHLSGQVPLLRPALAIRLREGPVRFPPSRRDAPLVAGAVFDLLSRRGGGDAASVRFARQPAKDPARALESALEVSHAELVSLWRAHVERLASPRADVTPLAGELRS